MKFGDSCIKSRKFDDKIKYLSKLTKEELAKEFKCDVNEIFIGNFYAKCYNYEECPYKVILGFANFEESKMKEGKLETIIGTPLKDGHNYIINIDGHMNYLALSTKNSAIVNCKSIKNIYGNWIINPNAETLGSVQNVYGALYLNRTQVKDTGKLKYVGLLNIDDSNLTSLTVDHIGKLICTRNSYITNFDGVKKIDDVMFHCDLLDCNAKMRDLRRKKEETENKDISFLTRLIQRSMYLDSAKLLLQNDEVEEMFKENFTRQGQSWVNNNQIKQL